MACQSVAQLTVRLTHLDHYLSDVLHPQWDTLPMNAAADVLGTPPRAPVIRIFGRTANTQQTICVHVHGIWPYLYIPCLARNEDVGAERAQLALSLDQALASWLHHSAPAERDAKGFVAGIVRVRATPFYGYAVGEQYFWKIYLVNPTHKGVVANLLRRGVVMDTCFDVYESHIPYILQFMVDCNVAGMDWIHLIQCWQRSPNSLEQTKIHSSLTIPTPHLANPALHTALRPDPPQTASTGPGSSLARQQGTRAEQMTTGFLPSPYGTTTWCALELDTTAGALLNHHWVMERPSHHQVQVSSPPLTPKPHGLIPSLEAIRSLVQEFRATRYTPARAIVRASQPWDPNHTDFVPTSFGWASHDYLRAIVQRILAQNHLLPSSVSFDRLCRPDSSKDSCDWDALRQQLYRCWALHKHPKAHIPLHDPMTGSNQPLPCNCPTAFQASRYSPVAMAQEEHELIQAAPAQQTPHKSLATTPLKVNETLLCGLVATTHKPVPRQSPLFRSPWNRNRVTTSPANPCRYDQLLSQTTCPMLSPSHLPDGAEEPTNPPPNPNDSDSSVLTESEVADEDVWEALQSIVSPPTSPDNHHVMTIPQLDGADDQLPVENPDKRQSSASARGRRQGRYRSVLKRPLSRSPNNGNAPLRTPRRPKIQLASAQSLSSSTNWSELLATTPLQRSNRKVTTPARFPTLLLQPLTASSQPEHDGKRPTLPKHSFKSRVGADLYASSSTSSRRLFALKMTSSATNDPSQLHTTRRLVKGTVGATEHHHLPLAFFNPTHVATNPKESVAASIMENAHGLDLPEAEHPKRSSSNGAVEADPDDPITNEANGIDVLPTLIQPLLFSSPSLWTPPARPLASEKTPQTMPERMTPASPLNARQGTRCRGSKTKPNCLAFPSAHTPGPCNISPKPQLTTRDLFETPISQLSRTLDHDRYSTPSRAPKHAANALLNQSPSLPNIALTSPPVSRQLQQVVSANQRVLSVITATSDEHRFLCSPDLYATPEMNTPSLLSTANACDFISLGAQNDRAEDVMSSLQLPTGLRETRSRLPTDYDQVHLVTEASLPEFPHVSPLLSGQPNSSDLMPVAPACPDERPVSQTTFIGPTASKGLYYAVPPTLSSDLLRSMASCQLLAVAYQAPYKMVEALAHKPTNDAVEPHRSTKVITRPFCHYVPLVALNTIQTWAWAHPPPTPATIHQWIHHLQEQSQGDSTNGHAIGRPEQRSPTIPSDGVPVAAKPTPSARTLPQPSPSATAPILMAILSLEIHVNTRGSLWPDPSLDTVQCIFCSLWTPREANLAVASTSAKPEPCTRTAYVLYWSSSSDGAEAYTSNSAIQHDPPLNRWSKTLLASCRQITPQVHLIPAPSERAMLAQLVTLVTQHWDPDVLTGYDVDRFSWGYLIDRATDIYHQDLARQLGRVKASASTPPLDTDMPCRPVTAPEQSPYAKYPNTGGLDQDDDQAADHPAAQWQATRASSHAVAGRHTLNLWRVLKEACGTGRRSFEHDVYHVLSRRVPHYAFATLTQWYTHRLDVLRCRVFQYYVERADLNHQLLDASEVVHHKSNFAKVYGIDFYATLTRGSQFKVEAMLLRITKPENFVILSPSAAQVARQPATEYIPLVMEPQAGFYTSPMLVLDFQSLYPSIMIAYNYCYSTCLGPLSATSAQRPMGVTQLDLPPALVATLATHHQLQVAPNGVGYVKASVRQGLLGRMLTELLDTRISIKDHMKEMDRLMAGEQVATTSHPPVTQATLTYRQRQMSACQLALKLLANVTYGYTGASFSGRMPCSTLADSIVSTARETLERTIQTINNHPTWQARVVYGDTDSVFVYLPGSTRDRAFAIGQEIATTITHCNPAPVKLKFEKVYHPCILLTKKRYVGHKFEHPRQTQPTFEAKGTEAIRRDGCPAVQRIAEQCLTRLFTDPDITALRAYLQREWAKIMSGRVAILELTISKAVKLRNYSEGRLPPPSAIVALKAMAKDPRRVPAHGERVPYVVVYGGPHDRLADQIADPRELTDNSRLRIHGRYYITRQLVPVLNRYLSLLQIDVGQWFAEMPKSFTNPQLMLSGIISPLKLPTLTSAAARVRRLLKARRPRALHCAPPTNTTVFGEDLVPGFCGQSTIDQFYQSRHCLACWAQSDYHLCEACQRQPQLTGLRLMTEICTMDRCQSTLDTTCHQCSRLPRSYLSQPAHQNATCDSLDCPIFYQRASNRVRLRTRGHYYQIMDWLDAKTVDQWF